MDVEQMKEWIASGEIGAVEEAWMAAGEADEPVGPDEAGEVLTLLVEAGHDDLADALGWALLEERKEGLSAADQLALAKAMAQAVPLSGELRQQACELYRELLGDHAHFETLVRTSELMNAPTPRRAFATLDLCLRVTDGCYLANRFRNQVLQLKRYDATLSEYELEDLAGGRLSLDAKRLADEFERIDETDFRVLSRRDPERLRDLFQTDAATVLIGVCQSHDGRIDSTSLKELLVPRYIEKAQWSSWWGRARTAAKRCERLSLEGRNPIYLVYHPNGLSLEQELAAEAEAANTPLEHLELLRRYAREAKQRKVEMDSAFAARLTDALAEQARAFLAARPTDALEASLALLEAGSLGVPAPSRPAPSPREVLASTDRPADTLASLADPTLWPGALEALSQLDDAGDQLEAILPKTPTRQLDRVADLLRRCGREQALCNAAARALAEPLKYLGLCLWLWADPAVPVPGVPGKLEILSRLLKTLHDLDIDLEAAESTNRKELQRRIRTALGARDLAGFREVVAGMDEAMASIVKGRIERTDGLAESVRDDMLKVLRENFYGLFAKAKVEPWLEENTLWTTEAALHRCEADLRELVDVKIPANSRAIGEAAEHGDLSENSEWKFAIEERNTLQARQAKMQDDLAKARIFHPGDVPTNSVGIGSRVIVKRAGNDVRVELSLLGPWDTDVENRRYSYKTALAQSLMGKTVGDAVALKIEGDEVEYQIERIDVAEF